jgi:Domain of unknown function (DUF6306)
MHMQCRFDAVLGTEPTHPLDETAAMTSDSRPCADTAARADAQTPTGPIARDALLTALNELLEAERAGARVAMETGREVTAPDLSDLVGDIHKDEVRWCGMLMRAIKTLDATPSSVTGAFHGKAMAIAGLEERLAFLNRGQAWVVRRLQALIPRVEDAALQADLQAMLEAHHLNIARVDARAAAA